MMIKSVRFIKSAVQPAHYPDYEFPEIAFAGRSNVGKSSLINTLIQRRDMVKTSSKPGCTQLINFFLINEALSFVDLPGYGYAKVSQKIRAHWQPMIHRYLAERKNLLGLILLTDIRRGPEKEEDELTRWMEDHDLPYLMVLTKADKLSKSSQQKRLSEVCARIGRDRNEVILFSSKTKLGRETILEEIRQLVDERHE